jgi:predicted small lipoprotein YifL
MKYLLLLALAACGKEAKLEAPAAQSVATTPEPCQSLDGHYTSEDGMQELTIKDCKMETKFNYSMNAHAYKANIMTTHKIAGVAIIEVYEANQSAYGFEIKDTHECTFSYIKALVFNCKRILLPKFYPN